MNENRYTKNWKENYPLRKETVERTFGDCKEQMGLRYTRYRGLEKNDQYSTLIFACHNLKKMAIWRWKKTKSVHQNQDKIEKKVNILNLFKKKVIYSFKHTTLSTA